MLDWLLGKKWCVTYREEGGAIHHRFEGRGNGFLRYAANAGEELNIVMPDSTGAVALTMMDVVKVERRITSKGFALHITVKVVRE